MLTATRRRRHRLLRHRIRNSSYDSALTRVSQSPGYFGVYLAAVPGTVRSSSSSQTSADESLGARQSPRGDSDPPEPTLGALGMAERLNWLVWKKRNRNTRSHFLIAGRSYARRFSGGK